MTEYNTLTPVAGRDEKNRMILRMEAVQKCTPQCLLWNECPYEGTKKRQSKCQIEVQFLNGVFGTLFDPGSDKNLSGVLNDLEFQRVCTTLMPLYHQLVRMNKEAYTVKRVSYVNKQGSIAMHPVFREQREIIKSINAEMRELKLIERWEKHFGSAKSLKMKGMSIEDMFETGDPDYYNSMAGGKAKPKKKENKS